MLELLRKTNSCHDEEKLGAAFTWLESLKQRKEQWAARYTWGVLTLGMNSTQRAEAVHSGVKSQLPSNMLVVQLAKKLDEYRYGATTVARCVWAGGGW